MDRAFFNDRILSLLLEWGHLGEATNEMGTRLIGHTPHIAPKAYMHVVYAPLSGTDEQEFCERLGRPVPPQQMGFLRQANGLVAFSNTIRVFGYVPLARRASTHIYNYPPGILVPNVSARIRGLSQLAVVVGWYQADGSYVSIEEDGTAVRFDARGTGQKIEDWPDFQTWLSSEISALHQLWRTTSPAGNAI